MSNGVAAVLTAIALFAGAVGGYRYANLPADPPKNAHLVTRTPEGSKIYSTTVGNRVVYLLVQDGGFTRELY